MHSLRAYVCNFRWVLHLITRDFITCKPSPVIRSSPVLRGTVHVLQLRGMTNSFVRLCFSSQQSFISLKSVFLLHWLRVHVAWLYESRLLMDMVTGISTQTTQTTDASVFKSLYYVYMNSLSKKNILFCYYSQVSFDIMKELEYK